MAQKMNRNMLRKMILQEMRSFMNEGKSQSVKAYVSRKLESAYKNEVGSFEGGKVNIVIPEEGDDAVVELTNNKQLAASTRKDIEKAAGKNVGKRIDAGSLTGYSRGSEKSWAIGALKGPKA